MYRGKKVDDRWNAVDYAKALSCGVSRDHEDGAQNAGIVSFPPDFNKSPNTCKDLGKIESNISTWLPVSGAEDLKSGLLRGGRITNHPLKLKGDSFLTRDPDCVLPMPGPGQYRFCVGAFGLSASFLLALNSKQGVIYCWIASCQEWAELTPSAEATYLGSEAIAPEVWNVEAEELAGDGILFWPADLGLVAIKIDILSLSYDAKLLAEGRCISVPLIIKGKVCALIEKSDGTVNPVAVNANWESGGSAAFLEIQGIPDTKWIVAAATPHEVIWLSDSGQVVLRPNAQQYLYIPWEEGVEVLFQLGGPHCSADGNLWMQILHPTLHDGEKGFCFTQLGSKNPEQRLSYSARMLTGGSSMKVEKWLKEDPWIEPKVVANNECENNEAVVPVLESSADRTLLVLRVDHLGGTIRLFEKTDEVISTRFQIIGQHGEEGFYVKGLQRPWTASAFIFNGMLFIYHLDIGSLPGWSTVAAV